MTSGQRQSVETLFDTLADVPLEEAARRLESECADAAVREEVLRLLRRARSSAETSAALREQFEQFAGSLEDAQPGATVGQYQLIERIGVGGMGSVFKARQALTQQVVALKLIRPSLIGPELVRRFLFEVEVLGRLNHPGVARVYEAGFADSPRGRVPFFAMEFVEGRTLDRHLQETQPGTKDRVRLLLAVAEAVAHAHSRGVIHRDLKPQNVMVREDGSTKVLDFGIARAFSGAAERMTLESGASTLVGTPAYMAPEQVSERLDEIDPDTDVYALGVIGYEAICGRKPYAVDGKPLHELARLICEQEPARPTEPAGRAIDPDLQTILLKCLEKPKSRRYPTAAELGEDLRRWLAFEPIQARPAGRMYRLGKFIRRNRGAVTAAAALFAALLAGLAATTTAMLNAERQRRAAERERDNAAAVLEFFTGDVLGAAEPAEARGREVTVVDVLDLAARRVNQQFSGKPRVEAGVRNAIAETYAVLNRGKDALPHAQRAVELTAPPGDLSAESLADPAVDADAHLAARLTLARVQYVLGEVDSAEQTRRQVIDLLTRLRGPDHRDTLGAVVDLASQLVETRPSDALPLIEEALPRAKASLGDDNERTIALLLNRAIAMEKNYPDGRALEGLQELLEQCRKSLGEDHPLTLNVLHVLGSITANQDNLAAALPWIRQEFALAERVMGPNHADTLFAGSNLAAVLTLSGELTEAEAVIREVARRAEAHFGPLHPRTLHARRNLIGILIQSGRPADAEPFARALFQAVLEKEGPQHPETLAAMNQLAWALRDQPGREGEAEPIAREMLRIRRELHPADHPLVLRDTTGLCRVLVRLDRSAEAVDLLEPLIVAARARGFQPRPNVEPAARVLAEAYRRAGRSGDADALLAELQASTQPADGQR